MKKTTIWLAVSSMLALSCPTLAQPHSSSIGLSIGTVRAARTAILEGVIDSNVNLSHGLNDRTAYTSVMTELSWQFSLLYSSSWSLSSLVFANYTPGYGNIIASDGSTHNTLTFHTNSINFGAGFFT